MIENYLGNMDQNNIKYLLLGSAAIGLFTLLVLKKLSKKSNQKYKFPIELDLNHKEFNKDFLTGLQEDHEKFLLLIQKLYPNECTLTLKEQAQCLGSLLSCCNSKEKKIIVLNSMNAVKRFSKQNTIGGEPIPDRPKNFLLSAISKGYLGSFFRMHDDKLKEIRKSSLAGLTKLSGLPTFETGIMEEIQQFLDFIADKNLQNKPSCILENAPVHLQQITTNIIVQIGLGLRFDYEHDSKAAVKQQINHISELLNSLNIVQIDDFKSSDQSAKKDIMDYINVRLNGLYDFLTGAVVGYKTNYDPDVLATFADYVIGKQREKLAKEKKLDDSDNYSDKDIIVQVFTLFMAGAATTGFSTSWAMYYLAKNPHVQQKIYDEIVQSVGTGSLIYPKFKENLPYTQAVINEILRLSSTQALIPRSTSKAVKVDGYDLPENTTVLINMYAIHRDPEFWKNSEELRPERWLDEKQQLIPFLDSYIPFGTAPRQCLGDSLSKLLLFVIVSNLVQRFQFEHVATKENESKKTHGSLGVMRRPHNYNLKITRRD